MSQHERYGLLTRIGVCLLGTLLAVSFIGAPPAVAQVLDANGYVTSNNFLALGPFPNPFGCSENDDNLCNHLAPSWLHCQYPELDDEVVYDPALACSTGYTGPTGGGGLPVWRLLDDGSDDCNNDLDLDVGVDTSDVVTFLCTYVENDSADDMLVNLCLHSDDGIQVWLDDQLVHQNNACRGWGDCAAGACQDTVSVVLTEGMHRFIVGVWERAGGWGGSLGFRDESGNPILEGVTDLVFHGVNGQGFSLPCVPLPARLVTKASEPEVCPPGGESPVSVVITQESGDAGETVTVTETVTFAAGADITIDASANGGVVTDVISADDGLDPATGAALEFFVLGPITNLGAAAPGLDAIREEYLSIPDADVEELDEGDTVNDRDGVEQTVRRLSVNNGDALDFTLVGGAGANTMHYAWTKLTLAEPTDVIIGVNADDSVQVLANGDEVTIANHDGGFGGIGTMEWSAIVSLPAGDNTIVTKTFNGAGGHGVRLLFYQLPTGGIGPGGLDCASATTILPGETGVGDTNGGILVDVQCADETELQISPAHYFVVDGTGETMTAQACNPVFLYDTYLAVFADACDVTGCLASNDDTCGRQSQVQWDSVVGATYYIRVYGWADRRGVYFLRVSDANTPAEDPLVPTPLAGEGVCASPDGACDTEALAVTGKTITWNVERSVLQGAGVSYEVDITEGMFGLAGEVAGVSILGTSSVTVSSSEDLGPFDEINLTPAEHQLAHSTAFGPCTANTAYEGLGNLTGADGLNIVGDGTDIWGQADEFQYVYGEMTGDFDARVVIAGRAMGANNWAKHGIMARVNCNNGSAYAYVADQQAAANYDNETALQWRTAEGIGAVWDQAMSIQYVRPNDGVDPTIGHADQLRLVRTGNVFEGYGLDVGGLFADVTKPGADQYLDDWVPLGSIEIPDCPETIQLGLAVTSHVAACAPVEVTFDEWEVNAEQVEPMDQFGRGDSDANGGPPNITDGIFILNFLFLGGPTPVCMDAADADDNGNVNITDGIFVLNFLFLGGPAPPTPAAPTCGEDPTDDILDCLSFPPCE